MRIILPGEGIDSVFDGVYNRAIAGQESAGGVLDGRTFVVVQGEKGEKAKGTDTLIFKNGKFRSAGCDKYGFGEAPYTTTAEGDVIKFIADTTSETNSWRPGRSVPGDTSSAWT